MRGGGLAIERVEIGWLAKQLTEEPELALVGVPRARGGARHP